MHAIDLVFNFPDMRFGPAFSRSCDLVRHFTSCTFSIMLFCGPLFSGPVKSPPKILTDDLRGFWSFVLFSSGDLWPTDCSDAFEVGLDI